IRLHRRRIPAPPCQAGIILLARPLSCWRLLSAGPTVLAYLPPATSLAHPLRRRPRPAPSSFASPPPPPPSSPLLPLDSPSPSSSGRIRPPRARSAPWRPPPPRTASSSLAAATSSSKTGSPPRHRVLLFTGPLVHYCWPHVLRGWRRAVRLLRGRRHVGPAPPPRSDLPRTLPSPSLSVTLLSALPSSAPRRPPPRQRLGHATRRSEPTSSSSSMPRLDPAPPVPRPPAPPAMAASSPPSERSCWLRWRRERG
ncbi:hypothetical protein BS78_09G129800, partial [Paspalum vaginatum]